MKLPLPNEDQIVVNSQQTSQPWKVRSGGYSYPVQRDRDFLLATYASVMPHVLPYKGSELMVTCYVPYGSKRMGEGHIALSFCESPKVLACVGIGFGVTYDDGTPFSSAFDETKWKADPESHYSSSIYVMTFEEAWTLTCWIGEDLDVRDLKIRNGA